MKIKGYGNREKPFTKEQIQQCRKAHDPMGVINMMYFNIAKTKKIYPED